MTAFPEPKICPRLLDDAKCPKLELVEFQTNLEKLICLFNFNPLNVCQSMGFFVFAKDKITDMKQVPGCMFFQSCWKLC